jgi:hypothetical protein
LCTIAYRAMSIARAMRVRKAAMTERADDHRASVTCEERDNRKAIRVATAARSVDVSVLESGLGSERGGTCRLGAQQVREWIRAQQ